MEQRSLESLENNLCTGLLIAFKCCSILGNLLGSVDVSGTAAADDALFYSCSCCSKCIFHTKLLLFHLCLGSCTYADNANAAGKFSHSLIELLTVEIRSCLFCLCLDLLDSRLDRCRIACTVNDDGVLFVDLDRLSTAEHIDCGILEILTEVCGNNLTACKDSNILKHCFSSVAIARSLDSNNLESTSEVIQNDCGKCFAFHVIADDEER